MLAPPERSGGPVRLLDTSTGTIVSSGRLLDGAVGESRGWIDRVSANCRDDFVKRRVLVERRDTVVDRKREERAVATFPDDS